MVGLAAVILLMVVLYLLARENNVSPDLIIYIRYPIIYGDKAFQVLLPTTPSGDNPKLDWNCFTEFCVRVPKIPSIFPE